MIDLSNNTHAADVRRCYATPPESGRIERASRRQTLCGALGIGAEDAALFQVNTDILIDYLQRHLIAVRFVLEHADRITVSAKSVAELYAGVRGAAEDAERQDLENFLALFPVVPVNADIARVGRLYHQAYGPIPRVGLADAVIATVADLSESAA